MGVSTRNTFLAALAATSILALGALVWTGSADGQTPCSSMGCGTPGPAVTPPPPPSTGCCGLHTGANVIVPGVHVAGPHISVTAPHVSVTQGKIVFGGSTFVGGHVSGEQATFLSGGGAYFAPQGIAPSTLNSLNVAGAEERYMESVQEQVPVQEEVCVRPEHPVAAVRPVRAVCLDDTGSAHSASQVTGERQVGAAYTGEIYRCMAGTSMQVTIGRLNGTQADFTHAESFSCAKGEALVRSAAGTLSCAPQSPERDCNERSLLRQYGPGEKLIQVTAPADQCVRQIRTRMETRTRQVERVRAAAPAGPIVFDGGVGQSVY